MNAQLPGIHHVTAITGDAQKNIDFYTEQLGLRLVKLTVNFDDPSSYHLYYGDQSGSPGTIMTFFAAAGASRGQIGAGQASVTAFAVPRGSLEKYWQARFPDAPRSERFGQAVLTVRDPDGLMLELVESAPEPPSENTMISGFHGVTLSVTEPPRTEAVLRDLLEFTLVDSTANRQLWRARNGSRAPFVELLRTPAAAGRMGAGVVHHVALRTPDDEQQNEWRSRVQAAGLAVSPVMDRKYFHSIYFREPGGVLFEIATDPPGFTVDQPLEELGTRLVLPDWLEPRRELLETLLPPLRLPLLR